MVLKKVIIEINLFCESYTHSQNVIERILIYIF